MKTAVACGYVKPESLSDFKELYRRVEAGEPKVSRDIWFAKPDRSGWWCERICYTNLFDSDGNVLQTIGVGRNITQETIDLAEKQQMELALSTTTMVLCVYDIQNDSFANFSRGAEKFGFNPNEKSSYKMNRSSKNGQ